MDAEEARKLTTKKLETVVIERFIKHIDNRIGNAARDGKSSIHNPQVGNIDEGDVFYLTGDERKAVKKHYTSLGFEWVEHAGSDPGHPCRGSYDTLDW